MNYKDNCPNSLLYFVCVDTKVYRIESIQYLPKCTPGFENSVYVKEQCPETLDLGQHHCLQTIFMSQQSERNSF